MAERTKRKSKLIEYEIMRCLIVHKKTGADTYMMHTTILDKKTISTTNLRKYLRKALKDIDDQELI